MKDNVLDNLLFNLHTIATLQVGKKISTRREFLCVEDESLMQPFYRWRTCENRDKMCDIIGKEIKTLVEISTRIMESRFLVKTEINNLHRSIRIRELKKIRNSLMNARNGISNLCMTYENDTCVLAKMCLLVHEIEEHSSQISTLLVDLNEITIGSAN